MGGDICVDANFSGLKDDALEKRKSEASDLDSALAKRRTRHKSLAIRRNLNSCELEGDICVDANFSGLKDDASEKRKSEASDLDSALAKRRTRHKSLAIRRNLNSSELEGDIC